MSVFHSLCIAVVLFSLAGCDKLASMTGPAEASLAEKIYQSKTEEEAFERIRQFSVGTWTSTESGETWWRLDVPPGGRTMTVYMADPTSNDWGEGITDELEPFQSKWSDTGQLMFGFKTKGGALWYVIGPDGKLAYRDHDEGRFYRLNKGDNSRFASPLPTHEAREERQSQTTPSKCELIAQGEADTRRQCDSGNLNACRDITGWVANKVMEGCATGNSSVAQQAGEENNQIAAPGVPPQSSFATGNTSSGQEQYVGGDVTHASTEAAQAEEASVDTASKDMNPPRYPPAAARAGIEGEVILVVDVDGHGRVTNVTVDKSSRNRDLDRAAVEAARKWRFNPAKSTDGRQMAGRVRVPVTFGMSGGGPLEMAPQQQTESVSASVSTSSASAACIERSRELTTPAGSVVRLSEQEALVYCRCVGPSATESDDVPASVSAQCLNKLM